MKKDIYHVRLTGEQIAHLIQMMDWRLTDRTAPLHKAITTALIRGERETTAETYIETAHKRIAEVG